MILGSPQSVPLTYEIVEPLQSVRYALARNDAQPIAYDITFEAAMPPFFENRHKQRERDGFRVGSDVVRYHQIGAPRGWLVLEGERIEVRPEEWTEYRDHSWGTRLDVGNHNADIRPTSDFGDAKFGEGEFVLIWSPFMLEAPNGEKWAYHFYFMSKQGYIFYSSGYRNHPDGTTGAGRPRAPGVAVRRPDPPAQRRPGPFRHAAGWNPYT